MAIKAEAMYMCSSLILIHATMCLLVVVSSQPFYEVVPVHVVEKGKDEYRAFKDLSKQEGFIRLIFGTDCYTQSVAQLDKECRRMTTEERHRLAATMANCFMSQSGHKVKSCDPQVPLQECTADMSEKTFAAYTEFFANIHSICLFLQNQDFQRQTENTIRELYHSALVAQDVLNHLEGNVSHSISMVRDISSGVQVVKQLQAQVTQSFSKSALEVQEISRMTQKLDERMNKSLEIGHDIVEVQARVMGGLEDMEKQERIRAEGTEAKWKALQAHADALEARQQRYETAQEHLTDLSEKLLAHSGHIKEAVATVIRYEAQSDRMMTYLLGKSYTLQDVLFYSLMLMGGWALTSLEISHASRPAVLLVLAASLAGERLAMSWMNDKMVFEPVGGQLLLRLFSHTWDLKWMIRKCSLLLALGLLLATSWRRYKKQRDMDIWVKKIDDRLRELADLTCPQCHHHFKVTDMPQQATSQHHQNPNQAFPPLVHHPITTPDNRGLSRVPMSTHLHTQSACQVLPPSLACPSHSIPQFTFAVPLATMTPTPDYPLHHPLEIPPIPPISWHSGSPLQTLAQSTPLPAPSAVPALQGHAYHTTLALEETLLLGEEEHREALEDNTKDHEPYQQAPEVAKTAETTALEGDLSRLGSSTGKKGPSDIPPCTPDKSQASDITEGSRRPKRRPADVQPAAGPSTTKTRKRTKKI